MLVHNGHKGIKTSLCLGVVERSGNIVQYLCTVLCYDVLDYLVHSHTVVDADIAEFRVIGAVEYNRGYSGRADFFDDILFNFTVADSIGHKYSAVKSFKINKPVDAIFADIKTLAGQHSSERSKIADIDFVFSCSFVDTGDYGLLILLINTGYGYGNVDDLFITHTLSPAYHMIFSIHFGQITKYSRLTAYLLKYKSLLTYIITFLQGN